MGLILPSATLPPSRSSTYAMGLLLPSSTPPHKNLPHPEPESVSGELTPENGLYSMGTAPVYPEGAGIPEPENQIPSPDDIDICKFSPMFVYNI